MRCGQLPSQNRREAEKKVSSIALRVSSLWELAYPRFLEEITTGVSTGLVPGVFDELHIDRSDADEHDGLKEQQTDRVLAIVAVN